YKPVWFDSDSSTLPFEKEADAHNHWGNWEVFHRMAVTRYEKARQLWEQYCLPFEEELILHKDSLEHRDITAQAFDTGWKIAKKMASLLQGSPIEAGFFNKRYWEKKNRELQELKAKNFKRPGFV
ncbi:MAG TPA: dipeptidase, partial [Mesotoga infera]|nr:dipeptidase [Mesotoga infera]